MIEPLKKSDYWEFLRIEAIVRANYEKWAVQRYGGDKIDYMFLGIECFIQRKKGLFVRIVEEFFETDGSISHRIQEIGVEVDDH